MIQAADFGPEFTKWDAMLKQACDAVAIEVKIAKAICMIESSLGRDPRVARGLLCPSDVDGSVSRDGLSWGLFQLRPETASDYDQGATAEKLNDPQYSCTIAAKHLRRLLLRFNSEEQAVRAYNAGEGTVMKNPTAAEPYWQAYQRNREVLG